MTITWYCAGTTSSRCERSSPITCIAPPQHGQAVSSGSTTISTRGRCSGSGPRPARRFSERALRSAGSAFSCSASALGDRLFEIFQSQVELVGIELFRAPAELHPLQLANQVAQSVVLVGERSRSQPLSRPARPRARPMPSAPGRAARQHRREGCRASSRPGLSHVAGATAILNFKVSQHDAGL